MLWHGGKLLAMEEGHPPYELDPHTLESIGSWNYRGKLQTAMTAHPKVDPVTGEMIFFAYMATGPFESNVMVHKVSPQGHLTESILIPTPYPAMVHDFVITENYIVLPVMPISGSLERAMTGAPPFAWEPEKGVHIAVLPRNSSSAEDVKWLEMDTCFAFHFMNGFDRDGVITIDACQFEHAPLFPTADGESTGKSRPVLSRWTADMNQDHPRMEFEMFPGDYESEFPQCDPRYAGKDYRYGWYTAPDGELTTVLSENELVYNVIGGIDHKTGAHDRYSCGRAQVSEALFVPRSPDAPEGDGFLLSVVADFDTRLSSLYIFDAQKIAEGPLAKARLSHNVPIGFHGTWRPG